MADRAANFQAPTGKHSVCARGPIGILMLETRFPRPIGDVGNPATWPFPVLYAVVPGASARRVVVDGASGLLPAFLDQARCLKAMGAIGLATSCGFLAPFGPALAEASNLPVLASSLVQTRLVGTLPPPGRCPAILTINAEALGEAHLNAADVPPGTPVGGLDPSSHLATTIMEDREELDMGRAAADTVDAAQRLVAAHPTIGAIVLECTNMGPYAGAVRQATGLPVFDATTAIRWFHAGL